MKSKLLVSCTLLLMVIALALSACSGPAITHELDGRKECTSCHWTNGVKPYPNFHEEEGFSNDDCLNCHDFNS